MKVYDAASIRNVALVGHSGSGKTQLAAALLFDAGTVNRFGKVDDGTTITDFDEEEIARKHTLSASLAYAEWNKVKINLIDTPGIGNFLSDARAALHVADAARRRRRRRRRRRGADREGVGGGRRARPAAALVVNRLDRERASLDRALQSLRERCSRTVMPIQLPIGEEKEFTRRRRPRLDEGLPVPGRRERQVSPKVPCPRDLAERPSSAARRSSRWSPKPTTR